MHVRCLRCLSWFSVHHLNGVIRFSLGITRLSSFHSILLYVSFVTIVWSSWRPVTGHYQVHADFEEYCTYFLTPIICIIVFHPIYNIRTRAAGNCCR